jgi:hypothetical protein
MQCVRCVRETNITKEDLQVKERQGSGREIPSQGLQRLARESPSPGPVARTALAGGGTGK